MRGFRSRLLPLLRFLHLLADRHRGDLFHAALERIQILEDAQELICQWSSILRVPRLAWGPHFQLLESEPTLFSSQWNRGGWRRAFVQNFCMRRRSAIFVQNFCMNYRRPNTGLLLYFPDPALKGR